MEKISTFSERLSIVMREANLSQSDLARLLGCNRTNICRYLNGRNDANAETTLKISRILNVNPDWLNGYDVPMRESRESEYFYSKLDLLNSEGRRKVEEYMDDLLDNPKYRKIQAVMLPKVKTA